MKTSVKRMILIVVVTLGLAALALAVAAPSVLGNAGSIAGY